MSDTNKYKYVKGETLNNTYYVGQMIKNPVSNDAFIFAGYDDEGNEKWCDVGWDETGTYHKGLNAPEKKTFEGFLDDGFTVWGTPLEEFKADIASGKLKRIFPN